MGRRAGLDDAGKVCSSSCSDIVALEQRVIDRTWCGGDVVARL